jgi:hypothetical protein
MFVSVFCPVLAVESGNFVVDEFVDVGVWFEAIDRRVALSA